MTTQPIEPSTEQDWLGNIAREQNLEALRHAAVHGVPLPGAPVQHYLPNGHRPTTAPISSLAELDLVEAASSAEALALMRTRLNTATLLSIAERESAKCEEDLQFALAVEDKARGESLKAAAAIDEFARKQAGE